MKKNNGPVSNQTEERDFKTSSQIQGNHGRATIRKIDSGINVSIKRGNVAGTKSLVFKSHIPTRQNNSLANTKVHYQEPTRLENQQNILLQKPLNQ